MIPEARRSAIFAVDRKAADQTLARNAGHYVLCRCLNGSLTKDNLIHAFIVAMQRSESRYKDDKRALGNKMQETCFLFAVLFVVRELCRNVVITPDEFVRIVSESINVHLALDKTLVFFGDAGENGGLQSMFWEAVCVLELFGVTVGDLANSQPTCPICFDPIGKAENLTRCVKPGTTLACGHSFCDECASQICRSDRASCSMCRAVATPLVGHRAIIPR
jgi:hypothetical protein